MSANIYMFTNMRAFDVRSSSNGYLALECGHDFVALALTAKGIAKLRAALDELERIGPLEWEGGGDERIGPLEWEGDGDER